jgi:hypothetical protein
VIVVDHPYYLVIQKALAPHLVDLFQLEGNEKKTLERLMGGGSGSRAAGAGRSSRAGGPAAGIRALQEVVDVIVEDMETLRFRVKIKFTGLESELDGLSRTELAQFDRLVVSSESERALAAGKIAALAAGRVFVVGSMRSYIYSPVPRVTEASLSCDTRGCPGGAIGFMPTAYVLDNGTLNRLVVQCRKCHFTINVIKGGASGAFARSAVGGRYLQHICSVRGATGLAPAKVYTTNAAAMFDDDST